MTQVNLLPPELRERQRTRRQTGLVIAGVALVLVVLVGMYVLQTMRLSELDQDLQDQQAANQELRVQIAELDQFRQLEAALQEREQLVEGLFQNQILWSSALQDISDVIPSEMWLTNLTGTVTQGEPGATTTAGGSVGSIQFTGSAFDYPTVALWLTRLEQIEGWENSWTSSAQKATAEGGTVIEFSGSVDLTQQATVSGRPE